MTEPFTRQQYTWEELTVPLTSAQSLRKIDSAGDYVRVDEASDPKAHVFVRLGSPFGPRRKLRLGGSIDGAEFQALYLDWPAQEREGSDFAWVKLLIARTFGSVYFQNPDPIELDITGLVKMAPHVITEGGRRADHRYELVLEPIIRDPTSVSYTAGNTVDSTALESGGASVGHTLVHDAQRFWGVNPLQWIREWDFDGNLLSEVAYDGYGEAIAYDSKRNRLAVGDRAANGGQTTALRMFDLFTRSFTGTEIALPDDRQKTAAYDPFRDRFMVSFRTLNDVYVFDAETGDEVDRWTLETDGSFLFGMLDEDRVLARFGTDKTQALDPADGSQAENFSWDLPSNNGGGVSRDEQLVYIEDATGNLVRVAWADVSYNAKGYATAGACGGTSLIEPEQVKVYADVDAKRLDSGKVNIQGEVIRAALELHFGARMPADYLDHVYLARFERTGRVVGAGAETWASAGIADDFLLELPQRIDLTIDSDLEPIY